MNAKIHLRAPGPGHGLPEDDPLADYRIREEPFYRPSGNEVELYRQAYRHRMPLILKGPTGCGKTRFVEHMAWTLGRPLITLACNEDMTASDLVGRYLLDASGTAWHDGPLTLAVRHGGICYLDEVVEARSPVGFPIPDFPLADANRLQAARPSFTKSSAKETTHATQSHQH